ncbi:MAG TPA: cytochrome b [Casimicrobiaceae bacterium]|nr:cytochrome b [Casimicrobiaceae bacterium]
MPSSDRARYTATAAALHWLIAALVVGMIVLGWSMQSIPKVPVGPRVDAFNLHKSIGLTILLLMVLRSAWRAAHPAPGLPPMPCWQARTARAVHALLYVCLFIQPLSGYLGSMFSGYPVRIYGYVLPAWGPKSDALKEAMAVVHLVNSGVLLAAIALHVAGALKHALIDRDGLVRRMWPWGLGA